MAVAAAAPCVRFRPAPRPPLGQPRSTHLEVEGLQLDAVLLLLLQLLLDALHILDNVGVVWAAARLALGRAPRLGHAHLGRQAGSPGRGARVRGGGTTAPMSSIKPGRSCQLAAVVSS